MAHEPKLIFHIHLDLSYNALDFNHDLRWTQERIRRRELGMKDQVFRTRNTLCFPEMPRRRGPAIPTAGRSPAGVVRVPMSRSRN